MLYTQICSNHSQQGQDTATIWKGGVFLFCFFISTYYMYFCVCNILLFVNKISLKSKNQIIGKVDRERYMIFQFRRLWFDQCSFCRVRSHVETSPRNSEIYAINKNQPPNIFNDSTVTLNSKFLLSFKCYKCKNNKTTMITKQILTTFSILVMLKAKRTLISFTDIIKQYDFT